MKLRVYFVGAQSTGKTTLARYAARTHGLPMVDEVARKVLARYETTLDKVRADIDAIDRFQTDIFAEQLAAEAEHESFVSDRACDNLAYAAAHARVTAGIAGRPECRDYLAGLRESGRVVFFVRPHQELLTADGVRSELDWGSVCRVDGAIQYILESNGVHYFPVSCLSMRDRCRLVDGVIMLAKGLW